MLPAFVNIIEKVVFTKIYVHFPPNNLFTSSQFGFREGISTKNGVSIMLDSIYHIVLIKVILLMACFNILRKPLKQIQ